MNRRNIYFFLDLIIFSILKYSKKLEPLQEMLSIRVISTQLVQYLLVLNLNIHFYNHRNLLLFCINYMPSSLFCLCYIFLHFLFFLYLYQLIFISHRILSFQYFRFDFDTLKCDNYNCEDIIKQMTKY